MSKNDDITPIYGLSELDDKSVFNSVIQQLEKDLMLSGFTHPSIDSKDAVLFVQGLKRFLNDCLQYDSEKLRALLYRIDISEKKINDLFLTESSTDKLEELVKLILLREIQKVLNRRRY